MLFKTHFYLTKFCEKYGVLLCRKTVVPRRITVIVFFSRKIHSQRFDRRNWCLPKLALPPKDSVCTGDTGDGNIWVERRGPRTVVVTTTHLTRNGTPTVPITSGRVVCLTKEDPQLHYAWSNGGPPPLFTSTVEDFHNRRKLNGTQKDKQY